MAAPNSRQTLIDYCLRRLGEPVLEINVDPDQLEDRTDEALQYWQEYHSEATFRTYISTLIGDSDVSNEYVSVGDDILYVSRMFSLSSAFGAGTNMFGLKYQMMLNDVANMQNFGGDLAFYEQMNQYLSMLDMKLNGEPQTTYSRKQNRLYIHGDFKDKDIKAGQYIVYEAYKIVNPGDFSKIYNDMWLKEYLTALIKQQWGANLIKFEGMQLPGGVTLNGRQIFDDATTEIDKLRERLRLEHEMPPDFFVG
jgi:hypothetical protein|tara:strand:+ start:1258 stop:2013 length:756 start_codon:yes stop_codon:yes gene_type:complete